MQGLDGRRIDGRHSLGTQLPLVIIPRRIHRRARRVLQFQPHPVAELCRGGVRKCNRRDRRQRNAGGDESDNALYEFPRFAASGPRLDKECLVLDGCNPVPRFLVYRQNDFNCRHQSTRLVVRPETGAYWVNQRDIALEFLRGGPLRPRFSTVSSRAQAIEGAVGAVFERVALDLSIEACNTGDGRKRSRLNSPNQYAQRRTEVLLVRGRDLVTDGAEFFALANEPIIG